jgi:hypothetical protein
MSYEGAMEAAGAEVLAFKEFGSYQGSWWAKILFEGKTYWVNGSYGSCSGCDAFQSEFGYGDDEHCAEHKYQYSNDPISCEACAEAKKAYQARLAEFGKSYIFGNEYSQGEAEAVIAADTWDDERFDILKFVQENAI